MKTRGRLFFATTACVGLLSLLTVGCGGGGSHSNGNGDGVVNATGGSTGVGSGTGDIGVINSLPDPVGASRVRLANTIAATADNRQYELQADGKMLTDPAANGQIMTSGDLSTGPRHVGVVDTQLNVPVSQFDQFFNPGTTTVVLYNPNNASGSNFQVTPLDINRAKANAQYAGVRLATFACSIVASNPATEDFTFNLRSDSGSRMITGQKLGAVTTFSLLPGTYQAQVLRADGTVVLDTAVTIPEANHRYTLLLRDKPASQGSGAQFDVLTDQ